MSNPFLGEVRMFGFNFAPKGWAECDGQLLAISQNTALFSLLGTFYGGNGTTNFALPNLQGNVPLGFGNGPGLTQRSLGETGGATNITLLTTEMPQHLHTLTVSSNPADRANATGNYFGVPADPVYVTGAGGASTDPTTLVPVGSSLPHNNMQPYLVLNFCIAMSGIFPARN